MSTDRAGLRIEYRALDEVQRYDRNPKRHDVGALCQSIARHGFRDAPIYDETLGALVAGHGRLKALVELRKKRDAKVPDGIRVDDRGRWWVPIQVGVNARTPEEAQAFMLDHNNLGVMGGDLGVGDMLRLYDQTALAELLTDLGQHDALPVSLDGDDLDALLRDAMREPEAPRANPAAPRDNEEGDEPAAADPRTKDAAPPTGYASAGVPLAIVLGRDEVATWRAWKEACGKKTDKAAFLELLGRVTSEGADE